MRLSLYSIFDRKGHVYLAPFPARSDVDARRQVAADKDNPQIKNTPIGVSPGEFELMAVAAFDDETGVVEGYLPRQIANIGDLFSSTVPS